MPLNDVKLRNAKPKAKPYKIADGRGLFLIVTPSGGKWWRYKYRFVGKEKALSLGTYPDISLAQARELHAEARTTLATGSDPAEAKKAARRATHIRSLNTYERVAREWHEQRRHTWTPGYAVSAMKRLEHHMFPKLGDRPISEIDPPELLSVVRIVENSGALDMAQRVMQLSGQIFAYAIATGRAERNPVSDLRGALKPPVRQHMAHFTEAELPDFLERLNAFTGRVQTKLALKFVLLTFVRTGELRGAEWSEIDFDKAEWRIPAERMKMREQHIVPLSTQALEVLREMQRYSGNRQHVFPNQHKPIGCMSENTILYALYDMGYRFKATGHGFRATASTVLNEYGFASDVIERQLAHAERNEVRSAYNHAQYLPERRRMMQWWADHLEKMPRRKNAISSAEPDPSWRREAARSRNSRTAQ